jgi:hypothetical protein
MLAKMRIRQGIFVFTMLFIVTACKTTIEDIERQTVRGKYGKAIRSAETILSNAKGRYSLKERVLASDYLRLCLLKTGNLNNSFFNYEKYFEMRSPIPVNNSLANENILLELGYLFSSYEINTLLLSYNVNNEILWDIIQKNSQLCGREKHLFVLRNGLNFHKKSNTDKWLKEAKEKRRTSLPDTIVEQVPDVEIFSAVFFPFLRQNKEILEYYTLLALYYKRLNLLSEIIDRYKHLNIQTLPKYVQEAALIYADITGKILVPRSEMTISAEKLNTVGSYTNYYYR